VNGTSFEVDARDNVVVAGTDKDGKDICISGTQDGGPRTPDNIFILSVSTLASRNVLTQAVQW
jgi:hypothetical protein